MKLHGRVRMHRRAKTGEFGGMVAFEFYRASRSTCEGEPVYRERASGDRGHCRQHRREFGFNSHFSRPSSARNTQARATPCCPAKKINVFAVFTVIGLYRGCISVKIGRAHV